MKLEDYIEFCNLLLKWGCLSYERALDLAIRQGEERFQLELLDLASYLEQMKVRYGPLTKAEKFVLDQKMKDYDNMEVPQLLSLAREWLTDAKRTTPFGSMHQYQVECGLRCLRLAILKARYLVLGTAF